MRTWAHERKFVMPVKPFPSKPDLNHLKYQAKDLLKGHAAHDRGVARRIREFNPHFRGAADAEIFAASRSWGRFFLDIPFYRTEGLRARMLFMEPTI